MKLLHLIFGNFGLKLLALIMAWGVWYIAHEDLTETARRMATVTVLVEGEDELEAYVLVPDTALVTVTVAGPQRAVSGFQGLQSPTVVARVKPDMLAGGEDEKLFTFDVNTLEFPDVATSPDLLVTGIAPERVKVKIRRMVVETKTVEVPAGLVEERHGVRFELEDWDKRVEVRGARVNLRNLLSIKTYADEQELEQYVLNMSQDELRRRVTLRLLIDPEQAALFELVGRTHLTATVQLFQVDETDLELPVRIHYASDGNASAPRAGSLSFSDVNELRYEYYVKAGPGAKDPPRVRLRLRGVPRALESVDASKLLAFVFANDLTLAPGVTTGSLPVRVEGLPPGVTLQRDYELAVELSH